MRHITSWALSWVLVSTAVQAQGPSDWKLLQALPVGTSILVTAQGREVSGKFHSASKTELWVTDKWNRRVIRTGREHVQLVTHVAGNKKQRMIRGLLIGVALGVPLGIVAGQGAGAKAIPIDMALFGGLGAFMGHGRGDERVVVVYRQP
jgi:hypothetical protein